MQYEQIKNNTTEETTVTKTLRLENGLIKEIEKLAKENERDFTKQVKFMLRQYIEITKKK